MRSTSFTKTVFDILSHATLHDPRADKDGKKRLKPLVDGLIRQVIDELSDAYPGSAEHQLLWDVRAAFARLGQALFWADNWVIDARYGWAGDPVTDAKRLADYGPEVNAYVLTLVLSRVFSRWNAAEADRSTPLPFFVQQFARRLLADERARVGPDATVADLGCSIRSTLAAVGLYLCRASAAIWQSLLDQEAGKPADVAPVQLKPTMAADAGGYIVALTRIADEVRVLDPKTIPAGRQMVAEANALAPVLQFLLARQGELRRWTSPEAFVGLGFSSWQEQSADTADRVLSLLCRTTMDFAGTVRGWHLRDDPEIDDAIVDVLSNLHQLARQRGYDWEDLVARADEIVRDEIEDDGVELSPA
jgi:hypothetical protein